MYVNPSFEQHINAMSTINRLFSSEVLVMSMLPEAYYNKFGVFMRDYDTWKKQEPLKAKMMHCVLQTYVNLQKTYYKRYYLSDFVL